MCGYFAIVTSEKMTASEALNLYKSRDISEKLFGSDKTLLGNRSFRVASSQAAEAKIFIQFIALIANFPEFYNSMSKKPTITAFFEV
ncbi:hypothetical protein LOB22_09095 [Lactobacillus delbrueckii subsp. lactis]|uniref:hypothetical protein n=1 Tax=Lactobacillus delbrueckii TaxID=1584 RepID=UPI00090BE0A3|nr:hypothetical protein [Lactobacillus delbrueckii]APG67969.1 hypothetical protein LL035_08835 [Lactobacillus delbrueckii subsp. lactis]MCD5498283.1 hypothetical protein [Lactobacillus delbrueckii subsp. lactis]